MSPGSEEFLSSVERSVQQRFRFKTQIAWVLEIVRERTLERVFDDVLFFAKFLTGASVVLRREGTGSENVGNLKQEFSENLEKMHTLLRTIVKEAPEPERGEFLARFLSMTPECMENLLALARELAWIKNYKLDQTR